MIGGLYCKRFTFSISKFFWELRLFNAGMLQREQLLVHSECKPELVHNTKGKRMFTVNSKLSNVYCVVKFGSRAKQECETKQEVPRSLTVRRGVSATLPTEL
jgi:hypothetical protein